MKIFPAIDIKDKKCVRLIKGDFENKTEYEMSPLEQAGKYKDHGFKNLHIVDLDGALTGETVNIDAYKIVENALSKEEGVKDVNSIKIVSIGTDKYLGIVKVDYLDSFTDLEIIEINKNIEESVKTSDARFSHLYLIPA